MSCALTAVLGKQLVGDVVHHVAPLLRVQRAAERTLPRLILSSGEKRWL